MITMNQYSDLVELASEKSGLGLASATDWAHDVDHMPYDLARADRGGPGRPNLYPSRRALEDTARDHKVPSLPRPTRIQERVRTHGGRT
jgi:hypothetical protein